MVSSVISSTFLLWPISVLHSSTTDFSDLQSHVSHTHTHTLTHTLTLTLTHTHSHTHTLTHTHAHTHSHTHSLTLTHTHTHTHTQSSCTTSMACPRCAICAWNAVHAPNVTAHVIHYQSQCTDALLGRCTVSKLHLASSPLILLDLLPSLCSLHSTWRTEYISCVVTHFPQVTYITILRLYKMISYMSTYRMHIVLNFSV